MIHSLLADEIEELFELNGSIFILIDIINHNHDILLCRLIAELLHDRLKFLSKGIATLGEIFPSPLASNSLNACLNSSSCSGLSFDAIICIAIIILSELADKYMADKYAFIN